MTEPNEEIHPDAQEWSWVVVRNVEGKKFNLYVSADHRWYKTHPQGPLHSNGMGRLKVVGDATIT